MSKSRGDDVVGDKLTELTGVQELGGLEGKFPQKGIKTLAGKGLEKVNKINMSPIITNPRSDIYLVYFLY